MVTKHDCRQVKSRNPIAKNMHKVNKPAVIPDKRYQLMEDMYDNEQYIEEVGLEADAYGFSTDDNSD